MVFAEDIDVHLREVNQPIVGTRHFVSPSKYDSKGKYVIYTYKDGLFDIKAELKNDNIIYSISHNGNIIEKVSFRQDSVSKWSAELTYDMHTVEFKFNRHNYFLIPGTKLNYNDTIYNEFPCMISEGEIKRGDFDGAEIYLLRSDPASTPTLYVMEEGAFHKNGSINGLNYKTEYAIGDIVPLNDKPYLIKETDWDNSKLSLSAVDKHAFRKIDDTYLSPLSRYFGNREYLFIDFWGTWCIPCIQAISKLKELYVSNNERIAFLSICYDNPENHSKYEEILDEYKVEWATEFISYKEASNLVNYLGINTFPTFVLVGKNGDIMFFLSGENEIIKIAALLESY